MQNLPKELDYSFLIRVLNKEISPEEKEYFESWLAESEKNREDFSAVVLIWDKMQAAKCPSPPDPFIQWDKISLAISENEPVPIIASQTISVAQKPIQTNEENSSWFFNKTSSPWLLKFAATFLIFLSTAIFIFLIKIPLKVNTSKQGQQSIVYETVAHRGEKVTVYLSDGSKVYLNADSKLVYPNVFDKDSRYVELEGEGYFAVQRDVNKPFRVKSGNTITVVRGTEFNIKSRNQSVSVVVAKGSVDTYNPSMDKIYNLKKGDMALFNEKIGYSNKLKADIKKSIAWREDKLSFDNASLKEVMEEIERVFNVNVEFQNDTLKNRKLTGVFNIDSVEKTLAIVSLTLEVKFEHKGRNILVKAGSLSSNNTNQPNQFNQH